MQEPLISVIIPLFNQEKYIEATVRSALEQTYKNIEIIVVDDGSTDNSAKVVKAIKDSRLKYFYRPNSGLPAIARNQGVKLAAGKLIAFLDHDDIWLSNKIDCQLRTMRENPEIKLISSNAVYFGDIIYSSQLIQSCKQSRFFSFNDLVRGRRMVTSTVLIDKSVINELGGFRELKDLIAIEDYDLWLRVAKRFKVFCLHDVLAKYRILSKSTSGDKIKTLERLDSYFNKYLPLLISNRSESWAIAEGRGVLYLSYALEHFKSGSKRYRQYLRLAFKSFPLGLKNILGFFVSFLPEAMLSFLLPVLKQIKPAWFYDRQDVRK